MQFNDFDKRIDAICGKNQIDGDQKIDEMGFGKPRILNLSIQPINIVESNSNSSSDEIVLNSDIQRTIKRRLSNDDEIELTPKRKKKSRTITKYFNTEKLSFQFKSIANRTCRRFASTKQ